MATIRDLICHNQKNFKSVEEAVRVLELITTQQERETLDKIWFEIADYVQEGRK